MEATSQDTTTTGQGCFGPSSPCAKSEAKEMIKTFDRLWKGKTVSKVDEDKLSRFLLTHVGNEHFHDVVRGTKSPPESQHWLYDWTLPTRRLDHLHAALAKFPEIERLSAPVQQLDDLLLSFPGQSIMEHLDAFAKQLMGLYEGNELLQREIGNIIERARPIELPDGFGDEQTSTLNQMLDSTGEELLRKKVRESVQRSTEASVRDYVLGTLDESQEGLLEFHEFCALYWWGGSDQKVVEPRNHEALMNGKDQFLNLKRMRDNARQIHRCLAQEFFQTAQGYYRAGDVFFRNLEERDVFHSVSGRCMLAVQRPFVGDFDHAGMIAETQVGKPVPYELFGGRNASLRSMLEYHQIFNHFYRINAHKLVSDEGQVALKAFWKDEWQERLQDAFHRCTQEVQAGLDSKTQGPQYRTVCSANSRKGFVGKVVPLGSLRVCPTPFDKIHEEVTQPADEDRKTKDTLCSQFVAELLVTATIELGKKLEQEVPFFNASELRMPFRDHRNLGTLLPHRMMDDFVEDGVVTRLPGHGPLGKLFKNR